MNPFGRRSGGSGAIAIQVLGCILAILLLCLPAFSQGNFGRIVGTVTDTSGGVVSGASVTVTDTDRGVTRTLITDDAGEYNAPNLTPSAYTVRAEAKGFRKLERQNIVLEVGKELRIDMVVQPGQPEQTVTVTESIPLVETTNSTLGGTLNNADINDMPLNGRNYQNLLSLRPGVMAQPGGGPWTQSTNNIRPDESAWMIDGVLSVSFYDARPVVGASSFITDAATILPIDAIQEFNLMENPKAEYGWKPGAVVNVGIRSGTNTLHGTAYAFGRMDSWDARNIFNPDVTSAPNTCAPPPKGSPAVCDKAPTTLKQFGGVVGGPIKKDKLFFFAGYEGLRSFLGNAYSNSVPEIGAQAPADPANSMPDAIKAVQMAPGFAGLCTGANGPVCLSPVSLNLLGCTTTGAPGTGSYSCTGGLIQNAPVNTTSYLSPFPNTNTSDNGVAKIDYRINSKNLLNGSLWLSRYYGVGEDRAMVNPAFENTAAIPNWNVVGNWIWTPSSLVVNEFRFGYTRSGQLFSNIDSNVLADGTGGLCTPSGCGGKGYPLNTGLTSVGGFPNLYIKGFLSGASIGSWRGRPQQNGPNPFYDVSDSVSYLLGKHSLKFGVEFAHIEADFNNHDERGRFDFRGGAIPGMTDCSKSTKSCPLEDFFAGALPGGNFAPNALVGSAVRTMTWMNYAGFVQDDWRVTPKLMLNLGLRYSFVSPFKEANNLLGNFDPNSPTGLVQEGQSSVGDTIWKPDHKNFSPRVGFAWDVNGKGTMVVRGGVGLLYSSFVAASFVQQAGQQNFRNGSIAAVPTGAEFVSKSPLPGFTACVPATVPATYCYAGTGTINLGTVFFDPTKVNWNAPAGGPGAFPGGAVSCTTGSKCVILAVDPNLLTPYITNWNLSVTRAFTNNLSLEVGYVGNHGSRLTGFRDINAFPAGGAARPFAAQFPYLSFIDQYSNDSRSNYHSLQATLTQRVTHGLSFTAGYTYAHALDNNSLNRFGALPQDSTNPGAEYASSDFDIRHRFTITASYQLPGIKGFAQLLEGWKLNTIVSLQSPQPWNVFDSTDNFSGSGDKADRWNFFGNPADFRSGPNSLMYCQPNSHGVVVCSQTSGISGDPSCGSVAGACDGTTTAALWGKCTALAPNTGPGSTGANLATAGCFVSGNSVIFPNATGTFGNMGRNIFRDTGFKNVDFSVFKNFTFKERYGAQFRVEFFNLFNHPIISNPNGASNGGNSGDDLSGGSTLGCGCGTPDVIAGNPIVGSGSARAMQLGLKLTF